MEIRLLLVHRSDLVAERTRTINRLCWHLVMLCPELEASLKRKALNDARGLDRVDRHLRKLHAGARARIARDQIAHLRGLNRQIEALYRELAELVSEHRPRLLEEQGCGALTAAILIGHTAGNERFRSEASFAKQTGTAPIPCSSGKRTQHRLNRGGDRQLNHALHIIAITRAQHDPATKEYLARKEAEGKTTKGALRSLKRYLARHFHRLLAEPPANHSTATDGQPIIEPHLAAEPEQLPPIPPLPPPRRLVNPNTKGQAPSPMVCIG
jgi:transposase